MEKDKELKEKKPANTRLKMTIGILFLVVLSVVELYLMINDADGYLLLGLVGLAILCFVYWTMDLSFKMRREQQNDLEKGFESLYKAQKVSYITLKQGLVKLEELLDELGEELSFPLEEVLSAQKAVGRVTIQKNKENFDAVVASNEKLIEHLESFEQKFVEIGGQVEALNAATELPLAEQPANRQEEILSSLTRMEDLLQANAGSAAMPDRQQEILDSLAQIGDTIKRDFGREPVADRQQEILDYLARIEASVKDEISELEVHMESKIDEIPSAVQEEQKMSAEELDLLLGETGALMESINLELPEGEGAAMPAPKATAEEPAGMAKADVLGTSVLPELENASEAGILPEATDAPEMSGVAEEMGTLPADAEESYEIPEHLLAPGISGDPEPEAVKAESGIFGVPETEESYEIPDGMDLPGTDSSPAAEESYEIPDGMDLPGADGEPAEAGEPFEVPDGMDLLGTDSSPAAEESYEIPDGMDLPGADGKPAEAGEPFEVPDGMDLPGVDSSPAEAGESYEVPDGMDLPVMDLKPQEMESEESFEIPDHLLMPEISGETEAEKIPGSMAMPTPPDPDKVPQAGEAFDKQSTSEPSGIPQIPPERIGSEKVMTPDEIAALLGEPGGSEAPISASEETAPTPDLSDPGHVMTPEEIAALLADM